ncbi:MAG: hypothetical protein Q9174_003415 [Haloplaca sp. 1 TL-2023]
MDKAKDLAKNGWHPKGKDGGKESWRGDNKGINKMAGLVGKGKSNETTQAPDHVSRPLATLKAPESFGPPPKNVNYHGGAAVPNTITPDRRGLGAPLTTTEIREKEGAERREAHAQEEAARKPAPPPVPYRVNTTGLSTSNLPKPPVRRPEYGDQSPASPARPSTKPKPSLPPRLPARQGSTPTSEFTSPPPPYSAVSDPASARDGQINQGAIGRLGAAGVSVPGFGIGSSVQNGNQINGVTSSPDRQSPATNGGQLSELQSRFAGMSTRSQDPATPSQGTSMAQKQAAMKTAQSFRDDPSSVSLSDARSTAATANNFRERHGDQVASGWKSANALNKKYDVGGRLNSYAAQNGSSNAETQQSNAASPLNKRPPPPPPQTTSGSTTSPPPVPLSSKPKS